MERDGESCVIHANEFASGRLKASLYYMDESRGMRWSTRIPGYGMRILISLSDRLPS